MSWLAVILGTSQEIWRRMRLPRLSLSHLEKPIFTICLLSWKWGGWQRCCCANVAIKWGSHLMGHWGTSGTRPQTERAPVTWTDKWCSAYLKGNLDECQCYVTEELFVFGLMDTGVSVCVRVCVFVCFLVFEGLQRIEVICERLKPHKWKY